MIIKTNVTVYQCEHCKHKMFVKKAMERHIKFCSKAPGNYAKCVGCVHLEETMLPIYYDTFSGEGSRLVKHFKCKELNKILYPLKAVKIGLLNKYPEHFEDQELMPNECEHFDIGI